MKIQTLFNEDKLFEMTLNYTQANQETNPWAGYSAYLGRLSSTEREAVQQDKTDITERGSSQKPHGNGSGLTQETPGVRRDPGFYTAIV